jgi:hypothetical protein
LGCRFDLFHRALLNQRNNQTEQWLVADYLSNAGVHPGAKVAPVRAGDAIPCYWAYIDNLQIVAEIGNDAYDPDDQKKDLQLFVTHPDVQQTVFALFQQAGAVVTLVGALDTAPQGPGWERIPGTHWYLHWLPAATP